MGERKAYLHGKGHERQVMRVMRDGSRVGSVLRPGWSQRSNCKVPHAPFLPSRWRSGHVRPFPIPLRTGSPTVCPRYDAPERAKSEDSETELLLEGAGAAAGELHLDSVLQRGLQLALRPRRHVIDPPEIEDVLAADAKEAGRVEAVFEVAERAVDERRFAVEVEPRVVARRFEEAHVGQLDEPAAFPILPEPCSSAVSVRRGSSSSDTTACGLAHHLDSVVWLQQAPKLAARQALVARFPSVRDRCRCAGWRVEGFMGGTSAQSDGWPDVL